MSEILVFLEPLRRCLRCRVQPAVSQGGRRGQANEELVIVIAQWTHTHTCSMLTCAPEWQVHSLLRSTCPSWGIKAETTNVILASDLLLRTAFWRPDGPTAHGRGRISPDTADGRSNYERYINMRYSEGARRSTAHCFPKKQCW